MNDTKKHTLMADELHINEMWYIGMRSHLATKEEREKYISSLIENKDKIDCKTYINELVYLMHTFFYSMEDCEKDRYAEAFLQKEYDSSFSSGEAFELLGIIFKGASSKARKKILAYIKENSKNCIYDASAIISLCNCIRCVYDEITEDEQKDMISMLNYIQDNNQFVFVNESIELTKTVMKEVL